MVFLYMDLEKTFLILEEGTQFEGYAPKNQQQPCSGEAVFSTGMTGYTESLTDPSYCGQLLTFTYPLLGNYGVPLPTYWESSKIQAKGVIFSSLCTDWNHHKGTKSFVKWLDTYSIPWICDIDTRALTKKLRTKGSMLAVITKTPEQPPTFQTKPQNYHVKHVSINKVECYPNGEKKLIIVDCGMKENILRALKRFPWSVQRVPYNYDYSEEPFDAIFLSNGPGDPMHCLETIEILKKAMKKKKPTFGICLGSQLLGLAGGAQTYKLLFGHRSHNQPCIDLETQKCYITSQNHGYAIDETTLPKDWKVTYRNLNDQSVEGISHTSLPFHAVQFHPEAAPGPTDSYPLFEQFYNMVDSTV